MFQGGLGFPSPLVKHPDLYYTLMPAALMAANIATILGS